MKRTYIALLLLLTSMVTTAQTDFKVYFANNVGDVKRVSKITANDKELTWQEIRSEEHTSELQSR